MKMTKLRKVFISMLAIVAICCSMLAFTVFASGEATLKTHSELNFTYGQQITKPTGELEYGGVTKSASVSVKYPDGKVSSSDIMVLDVEGVYTVIYTANFADGEKTATKTFKVDKPLYYMSKADSTIEYGTYNYSEHNKGAGYKNDGSEVATKMRNSSVSGLKVSLASGDVFHYSRMINLNGLTKDQNLLKMIITPDEIGAKDVDEFSVVLTDAHNPENYLTFQFVQPDTTNSYGYFRSGAAGQPLTGFNWNSWEGGDKGKYMNTNAGTVTGFGLTGPNEVTRFGPVRYDSKLAHPIDEIADNGFALSVDYSEKAFYNTMSSYVSNASKTFLGKGKNDMIIDFNDPRMFDSLWRGFTTGECFLSIKSDSFQSPSFNFVITEIIDQDVQGDQLKNTQAELEDMSFDKRGTLDIVIDLQNYAENKLPEGIVSMAYPILSATCENAYYGKLDVVPSVKDPSGNPVAVDNNSFTPATVGKYTIEYTVKDYRGTTNVKKVYVDVVESLEAVDVSIAGSGHAITGVAGTWIEIADENAINGSGTPTISYEVTLNNNKVDVKDKAFFADKSGTYTVKIIATDYLGQTDSVSYTVEIANGDRPVYLEKPILPRYFISGKTYELPKVMFYDYTSGDGNRKEIVPKIAYRDTFGLKQAVGREITPVVDDIDTTFDIIYYTESPTAEGNLVFNDLRIVNINDNSGKEGRYDFAKLLVGDNFNVKKDTAHSTIYFEEDIQFDYVNALLAEGMAIEFRGVDNMSFYNEITLTYTDSLNADEEIKFIFTPNEVGNRTLVYLNDYSAIPYEISQSMISGADSIEFLINVDAKTFKYDKYSASTPAIETYVNGEEFNGFSSGKVYVRMNVNGVVAESALDIVSIGGQLIAKGSRDNDAPRHSISGSYLGYKTFGDIARIPKALMGDTIDPSVKGYVTVYAPENENGIKTIVSSKDGVYLKNVPCDRDYFVELTVYGDYEVVFSAQDDAGNEIDPMSTFYKISVKDLVAPTIKLNSSAPKTGKVGSKITIPSATAFDAVSGNCKITIYMNSSKGVRYNLGSKRAFVPEEKGIYEVIYVATDASGNMASKSIKINVK